MAEFRGRAIPDRPAFRTDSERVVWEQIRAQMRDGDVLIAGLRFTDPQAGDVEADLLLFMPDRGVAVIEVKGGKVEYVNGEWFTTNGGGRRRIHPVTQARRAKHAVRSFLSRQEGWPHGLAHAEWFIAMPFTDVEGDLGPEGRRAQLIDRVDSANAYELTRAVLDGHPESSRLPQGPWVEGAVDLLLHAPGATTAVESSERSGPESRANTALALVGVGIASAIGCALLGWFFGWVGVLVGVGAAAILTVGAVLLARSSRVGHPAVLIALAVVTAAIGGAGAALAVTRSSTPPQQVTAGCNANYDPCVPDDPTITCGRVGMRVQVVGTDVFGLDRDGDGVGCETMPEPTPSQTP